MNWTDEQITALAKQFDGDRMPDDCSAVLSGTEIVAFARAILASQPPSVPAPDSEDTPEFDKGWLAGLAAATGDTPVSVQGVSEQARYLDEIDAARAGDQFVREQVGTIGNGAAKEIIYPEENLSGQSPRIKCVGLFNHNDDLMAAYLLTRDSHNRTLLTKVCALASQPAAPVQLSPGWVHDGDAARNPATGERAPYPSGLTPKQAWWAGYRAGKGLPPDTPRQEAVQAAPSVPEGWKPVPIEPTPKMLDAYCHGLGPTVNYRDMLAAAPSAPAEKGGT